MPDDAAKLDAARAELEQVQSMISIPYLFFPLSQHGGRLLVAAVDDGRQLGGLVVDTQHGVAAEGGVPPREDFPPYCFNTQLQRLGSARSGLTAETPFRAWNMPS